MIGRWAAVTVDCRDPVRLATFWHRLLGGDVSESLPGWRRVSPPDSPVLTFQPVPEEAAAKNRLHLDLVVDDLATALAEVEAAGGTRTGERHDYDEGVVEVVADPEGNVFCLVRYAG